MDSNTIRRKFLDFFAGYDHEIVTSASLIPTDPTLLLTSAGMVPFKPYFLGEQQAPYRRAASVQKCARTTDIDIVGTTERHFTFFEMLGNFSFGDYFKEKAIPWAYEFVTDHLGIDPDRLWYTVYETDDEAYEIWVDGVGVPPERVQRGGKDNFWQMGVAGPCGPSSEVFVDRGASHGEAGGPIGGDEDRYVEVWNLVFMQHIQDVPYNVVGDLPARNIDTGMGLDRTAMVLQDAGSVFETDAVGPILSAGAAVTGVRYGDDPRTDVSLRILADHGRALTFLISDGVIPSNEGRGYILRRLIRRAVRHAWGLGSHTHATPRLIAATVECFGEAYPEIARSQAMITEMAEREEASFRRTLESGHQLLDAELAGVSETLAGSVAFRLHDTYGFPVEITREIAGERGIDVDMEAFELEMEAQRERARTAWRGGAEAESAAVYLDVLDGAGPTEFLGYDHDEGAGRLLHLLRGGEAVERADEGDELEVFLDRTPFYAEGGGQVGDTGVIVTETGRLAVFDTQAPVQGLNGHRATVVAGWVAVGQDTRAEIDGGRRERIRKSHTGTHLLHWAIRDVLGDHARQQGSFVESGRIRFDFSHYEAPASEELMDIERLTNERVIENARVTAFHTSKQEAERLGALAFFGDKYGEQVRVVQAGDYSTELCGGTHTPSTGQVGPLVLLSEGSIGSNVRRVEALTGGAAYEHIVAMRATLEATAAELRAQPGDIVRSVQGLVERVKDQERRLGEFEDRSRSELAGGLAESAEDHGTARLVAATVPATSPDDLRVLALAVRERIGTGLVLVGSETAGKGSLVAAATSDVVDRGVSAGEIAAIGAKVLGGGGSRDPQLAQAGGPGGDRIEEAMAAAAAAAREALTSPT